MSILPYTFKHEYRTAVFASVFLSVLRIEAILLVVLRMAVRTFTHSIFEIVVVSRFCGDLVINQLIDAGTHELELDRTAAVHERLIDIHMGCLAYTRYSSDSPSKCCTWNGTLTHLATIRRKIAKNMKNLEPLIIDIVIPILWIYRKMLIKI